MYKVLIVDDEKNIRDRLTNSFTWNEWGFMVSGSAETGSEALQMIRKEAPHVVLTDIMMPEMDGIELARNISELYPQIKLVILSAYDDFKYARDAIKYGAKGYLLKPLIKDELEELFYRLYYELIEGDRERHKNITKDSILIDFLKGRQKDISKQDINQLRLECLNEYIRIAVCSLDQVFKKDTGFSLQQMIISKSNNYWSEYGIPIVFYGQSIILFINDTAPIPKVVLKKRLEAYKDTIERDIEVYIQSKIEITISVGNMYKGSDNICLSYNEANYACSYRYFKATDPIIFYQDISVTRANENTNVYKLINAASDTLVESVFSGEFNDIMIHTCSLFRLIEESGTYDVKDIQSKCTEILLTVNLKAKDKKIELDKTWKTEILDEIQAISSLYELKHWLGSKLQSISARVRELKNDNANHYVALAKEYMDKNYSKKITLEEMAEILHLNSAYFSYIFKKATGQNFIDYLNMVRVKKAAELIKSTDYTIKEISVIVGYNNVSYFNKVFKKINGIKPLIYRAGINYSG